MGGATTSLSTPAIEGSPGTCRYGTFDGSDDYIEIAHDDAINPDSFTLAFWAKVEGGNGSWRSPFTSRGAIQPGRLGLMIAMGPGFTLEVALLRGV